MEVFDIKGSIQPWKIRKPFVGWWGKAAMTRMIEVRGFANRDLKW